MEGRGDVERKLGFFPGTLKLIQCMRKKDFSSLYMKAIKVFNKDKKLINSFLYNYKDYYKD